MGWISMSFEAAIRLAFEHCERRKRSRMNPPELNWAAKVANLRATLGREPDLNELLTLARTHRMTVEEVMAQKRSFVLAEAGFGTDADELAYRRAVEHGDGAEIARLDAEAEARMANVRRIAGYGL